VPFRAAVLTLSPLLGMIDPIKTWWTDSGHVAVFEGGMVQFGES
jgi:hypothetical protein